MIRSKKWIREILSLAAVFGTAFVVGCADDNSDNAFNAPSANSGSSSICTEPHCGTTPVPGSSSGEKEISIIRGRDIDGTDTVYWAETLYVDQDTVLRWVGQSALRITEIAPLNLDWYDENGDDPSWIEIYNSGDKDINLKG